jgi:NMD protein affecting ribosome stability and mRNA decay
MSKRICDVCGKEKDVAGGKTCENGHFICKDCYWKTAGLSGLISSPTKYCPICGKPLR